MKKAIFLLTVPAMLTVFSCKKSNSPSSGAWTFYSFTYQEATSIVTDSVNGPPGLYVETQLSTTNAASISSLACSFTVGVPNTSGTYTVAGFNTTSSANQCFIQGVFGGTSAYPYSSTGGNGSNQHINVTVTNGKISISGTGIEMVNSQPPYDSSTLTFNIRQL